MPDAEEITQTRLAASRQLAQLPPDSIDPDGFAWSQSYRLDVTRLLAERDSLREERKRDKARIEQLGGWYNRAEESITEQKALVVSLREERDRAQESLRECIPYVNRALNPNDPDNAPWRIETATGVMERLRAALAAARPDGEPRQ